MTDFNRIVRIPCPNCDGKILERTIDEFMEEPDGTRHFLIGWRCQDRCGVERQFIREYANQP